MSAIERHKNFIKVICWNWKIAQASAVFGLASNAMHIPISNFDVEGTYKRTYIH